jgi:hypothetical protein
MFRQNHGRRWRRCRRWLPRRFLGGWAEVRHARGDDDLEGVGGGSGGVKVVKNGRVWLSRGSHGGPMGLKSNVDGSVGALPRRVLCEVADDFTGFQIMLALY